MSPLDDAVLPVVAGALAEVLAGACVEATGAEADCAPLDDAVLDGAVLAVELEVEAAGALLRAASELAVEVVRLPAHPTTMKAASAAATAAAERVRIMSCSSVIVDGHFGPQGWTQQRLCRVSQNRDT